MRAWWPLLWLLPTIAGVAAIAWRIAGREAALVASAARAGRRAGLSAVHPRPHRSSQRPDRADASLTVAATVWSDRLRWTASAAGALTGLAFAIGFEGMPYLHRAARRWRCAHVFDRDSRLRHCAAVRASRARRPPTIAFFVDVVPDRWLLGQCDAIAINSRCRGDRPARCWPGQISAHAAIALPRAFRGHRHCQRWLARCCCCSSRLRARAVRHGRSGGLADLAQPRCARCSRCRVFQFNPADRGAAIATFPAAALAGDAGCWRGPPARRDFGFLRRRGAFAHWPPLRWSRRSAVSPTRSGSACRWSRRWHCGCSRRCGLQAGAGALRRRTAADADGALGRHDHHRLCRRPRRHRKPATRPASPLLQDREATRRSAQLAAGPGRPRHQRRAIPPGADPALRRIRALSLARAGHRRGAKAMASPWRSAQRAEGCEGRLRLMVSGRVPGLACAGHQLASEAGSGWRTPAGWSVAGAFGPFAGAPDQVAAPGPGVRRISYGPFSWR